MRISQHKLHSSLKGQISKILAQLLADIKTEQEAQTFLKDFFTESELETYAKRLAVAYWLKKGRSYSNIKQNLKVSSATIATVQEMIDSEGVKLAIKKIEADEWANQWAEKISKVLPRSRRKLAETKS